MPDALEKAREVTREYQIDPRSFDDLYDSTQIERDVTHAEELEKQWQSESVSAEPHEEVNKKLADIFETIIFTEGEQSEWFGKNAFLIRTSKYDDYVNKADAVLEYDMEMGVSRLALAIDITFNHDVQNKVTEILKKIRNGRLTRIKYFESEVADQRGEINNIPHFILGADVDTVRELTNLWAANDKQALAKHGVQHQFFDEAILQCKYFENYAELHNQKEVSKRYRQTRKALEYQQALKKDEDKGKRDSFANDFQRYFDIEE